MTASYSGFISLHISPVSLSPRCSYSYLCVSKFRVIWLGKVYVYGVYDHTITSGVVFVSSM